MGHGGWRVSQPAKVQMYSSMMCPFCYRAKALLEHKGIAVEIIDVDTDFALRQQMQARSGRHTVPQIFINDAHVGGCDELYALEHGQQLDGLLAEPAT